MVHVKLADYAMDAPVLARWVADAILTRRGLGMVRALSIYALLCLSLLYIASPVDLIPEAVFGLVGFVDDLMVILLFVVGVGVIHRRGLQ